MRGERGTLQQSIYIERDTLGRGNVVLEREREENGLDSREREDIYLSSGCL